MRNLSGTKQYMPPELVADNSRVGPEIDMWSFGVILYQMCVGYLPTAVKGYKYGSGPLPFNTRDWRHFCDKGALVQDLICQCL